VRQLAAALDQASLLAGIANPNEAARASSRPGKSGSKLPHSKAGLNPGKRALPVPAKLSHRLL